MKAFTFFILSVAAVASVATNAQTESPSAAVGDAAATKEIRGWLDHWRKAVSAKDVDRVMELYTDDVVAYDVVPPLQYVGKAAYRGDYQQFFSQYESDLHVETRDLHVGASGEFGYATGLQIISGMLKHGQKSGIWIRFTSLYRKVNGKWLDFHDHVSVPADIESGKAMLDLKP
jgi:ketosteroid isomerase-like protein